MVLNGLRMPSVEKLVSLSRAVKCDYNTMIGFLERQRNARKN
jgi:hypothetical protein